MNANKGHALVTGAAGGMGRAIAQALTAEGHKVVLADRDPGNLKAFAAELGGKAFALTLDVTDSPAVSRLLDAIPEAFRPIDILINNAGHDIGGRKRFDVGDADDWAAIVETNLIGLMRVTRAVLPDMVKRNTGDIVNMSSINALRIVPDMAPYSASKAGVHMLTETIRGELAETGIRVTEINPGLTRTNIILTRYRGDRAQEKAYFDQFKLAMEPEDIARSIMFALNQPRHVQMAQIVILPVNRY
ncbi:MAG TPA: SDR family oxidoreductase [Alphaproteobacteria bacterium]|nr:SDR family oxidoreductase [Alphaproteobacteria bacterium]